MPSPMTSGRESESGPEPGPKPGHTAPEPEARPEAPASAPGTASTVPQAPIVPPAPDAATTSTAPPAPAATSPDAATLALADAVREVEAHVAASGWDAAPRLFALVTTSRALVADPSLAGRLPAEVRASAADPHHLLSVEQEGFASGDLDDALARIAWPDSVDGVALTVERIILPPSAEQDVPEDPTAALAYLVAHPARQDVRLAVGVLRDGRRWSAVRVRTDDGAPDDATPKNAAPDDAVLEGSSPATGGSATDPAGDVAFGPDLVPGLADALAATFED